MKVVNETVPNREINELIHARENLLLKFKRRITKEVITNDEENY